MNRHRDELNNNRTHKCCTENETTLKNIVNQTIKLYNETAAKNLSTSITIIERPDRKMKIKECEYLYIFGFGFDPLNISQIGLDEHNRWSKQCFVTNFGGNKKNERIIVNYLTNRSAPIKIKGMSNISIEENIFRLDFPIISANSVKNALEEDFSLVENVKTSECVFINVFGENVSSYYAEYKKF